MELTCKEEVEKALAGELAEAVQRNSREGLFWHAELKVEDGRYNEGLIVAKIVEVGATGPRVEGMKGSGSKVHRETQYELDAWRKTLGKGNGSGSKGVGGNGGVIGLVLKIDIDGVIRWYGLTCHSSLSSRVDPLSPETKREHKGTVVLSLRSR